MGYILPITNHTYSDYQKRIIKTPQDPHYVGAPYNVVLDIKQQELAKGKNKYASAGDHKQVLETKSSTKKNYIETKDFTKELYFNKYV